jgi:hypothetical protein
MIERWLQISCDNPDCAETNNSSLPNMTVAEFVRDISPPWRRVSNKHACSAACAAILRELQ